MTMRPWRRELGRRLRGSPRSSCSREPLRGGIPPAVVTLVVGLLLAGAIIGLLEARLRPIVSEAAQAQTKNSMTAVLEQAVVADLAERKISYSDLVAIQRDQNGAITSLTTDMASMNLLRAELITDVLEALSHVDTSDIKIPLGSLLNSELIWAKGPVLRVRSMSVGTVSAEFESEFSAAGVNQTRHRIWLKLSVPITIMLPSGYVDVPVDTNLCVAETVIVGQVPDTYLQFGGSDSS
ncbi:MAG: sporulation protein YunB [Lawsonibacter sp.]|nr:sporulation protein YunB [Lawsonibacter sp.]